ncbi:hypothetical protein G7Z17_g13690 [Cylindrodendrum hubeiense]|uniref:Uncharacterized protein n=1 Tax=Cylindrodendrum hubeiense TaxID=595255 RepID=A0A9P5GWJ8_9HYPO|nr:hypothetical protein G7Z17_g13690 [Cylindrodendrum hubeiense]
MHINFVLIAAIAAIPFSDAICALRGYSGADCTGTKGRAVGIGSGGACFNMENRKSYDLYGKDCGIVRFKKYRETSCVGTPFTIADLKIGCHSSSGKRMHVQKK